MPAINIPITICGLILRALIEYEITDRGRRGGRDFPTEPMEFDVIGLLMRGHNTYVGDTPLWLEKAILEHYDIKIYAAIQENERD